eukprot:10890852-Heterocapsa_arctica.AAC.1
MGGVRKTKKEGTAKEEEPGESGKGQGRPSRGRTYGGTRVPGCSQEQRSSTKECVQEIQEVPK